MPMYRPRQATLHHRPYAHHRPCRCTDPGKPHSTTGHTPTTDHADVQTPAGHPQGVALLYTSIPHVSTTPTRCLVYSRATPCGWPAGVAGGLPGYYPAALPIRGLPGYYPAALPIRGLPGYYPAGLPGWQLPRWPAGVVGLSRRSWSAKQSARGSYPAGLPGWSAACVYMACCGGLPGDYPA